MKKIISLILSLVMILSFTACGTKAEATWQEHYDLGLKYVTEAKYEEAILAFTKALEIDPKQAPVYIALAEVYVRQENYTAAQETLDKAITEIGETDELNEARDKATQPQQGEAATDNKPAGARTEKSELSDGGWVIDEYDENGKMVKQTWYNADGSIKYIDEYDENGNLLRYHMYGENGLYYGCEEYAYDENGKKVKRTHYNGDGSVNHWRIFEYHENGEMAKETSYRADGTVSVVWEYDENGNQIKETWYNYDGSLDWYYINTYDANGNCIRTDWYDADGSLDYYDVNTYDTNGNFTGSTRYKPDGTIME